MNYEIRPATRDDLSAIEALLPRLASFKVPTHRAPEQLWQGDLVMIRDWAKGEKADVEIIVANADDRVVGIAVISLGKELLSGEPSAHLEVLALDKSAEGFGIGSALMQEAESVASSKGAQSMSLHVFAANKRARALYEKQGFDGELLRYYKSIVHEPEP
jgi:ribosomal protein S18 acetylase RimI-like enzyme